MAKALLKEALSGSKVAVEAIDQSDTAHITFQKVCTPFFDSSMPNSGLLCLLLPTDIGFPCGCMRAVYAVPVTGLQVIYCALRLVMQEQLLGPCQS